MKRSGQRGQWFRGGWGLWILLLWTAAALRLPGALWDKGIAAHPDERFLLGVAQNTPLGANPCVRSPDFPYGHLPLTLASVLVRAAPEADPLAAARLLSGLGGVLLVAVSGKIGATLSRIRLGGLVAGALAAFCPLLIQQAHFYTVDPWAALFAALAVISALRDRWGVAGAMVGLGTACKATVAWMALAMGIGVMILKPRRSWFPILARFAVAGLGGLFVGAPWSLLSPITCWRGPLIQAQMASGRFIPPYTLQYADTVPWIYPLEQMTLWGMGLPAVVLGVLGMARAAVRRRARTSHALAWLLAAGFFAAVGALYVKYPRYLLPLYPLWIGWAAYTIADLDDGTDTGVRRWVRIGGAAAAVAVTAVPGLAQASVYSDSHPWVAASRWIYEHVPPDATVAVESWDHPLPVPLSEGDPLVFNQVTVPVLDRDSVDRNLSDAAWREFVERTRNAEVIVLASRRNYGVVARQPATYPVRFAWYRSLFENRTALVFTRCPEIGGLAFSDDPLRSLSDSAVSDLAVRCGTPFALELPRVDESFRVYDAPMTVLLVRRDLF